MALNLILSSFFKTLSQIGDRRFRRVLLLGIGLTFALLVAAFAGLLGLLNWIGAEEAVQGLVGDATWVADLINLTSFFVMLILSVFLMVPVASAITSLFLDDVAQAVEDRFYPQLPPVTRVSFTDGLRDTINFLGILIAANVAAFVLYLMFPPASLFIFWGLNGFLLGREYFTLAAMRRLGRDRAKEIRAKHRTTIWAAGTLMAIPLSVPLVNLLIPILGAATFTHIFHGLSRR